MRLRRVAVGALVAGSVFGAALALTFPTDAIVRWALARVTPPGSTTLVFERARLRPWGLQLESVSLHDADRPTMVSADWLTLRPSLAGLVRDRTGRPWHAEAGICGGTIEAVLDRDDAGDMVTLSWEKVDLGRCPPLAALGEDLAGLAHGTATVRRPPDGAGGELAVRSAWWKGAGRLLPGVETLHADPIAFRWTLGNGRVELAGIDLQGPEVRASGGGTVTLVTNDPRQSLLDLELAVTAGPEAPPALRDLLARLPRAGDGADMRRLVVGGTLEAPRVGRAP